MSLSSFARSTRGNFTLMFAITAPILLASAGMAIDISRLVTNKAILQNALDSAVLAASRINEPGIDRQKVFEEYFRSNVAGRPELSNVEANLTVENAATFIATRATATADVELSLMRYFGDVRRIGAEASAFEANNKIEVALVLDNTGSMGVARMNALRTAARSLLDILEDTVTPYRTVRAALVPFTTMVNVKGPGFKQTWIDNDAQAPWHGANFDPLPDGTKVNHLDLFDNMGVAWKGCVEARPAPHNRADNPPLVADPATLFVPYFAPDEPGNARKAIDSPTQHNNSYLDDMVGGADRNRQKSTVKYAPGTPRYIDEATSLTTGPNFACPTPIHPLTDDFNALRSAVAGMIHWYGSGTNVSEGLAWGLRVLSPQEPYNQALPFDHDSVAKFAVVFTDGENQVFGASSAAINKSDYGSYGFLDTGRMGSTNRATALGNVNTWTLDVCQSLKSRGVEIFTVLLGADTPANQTLYKACATRPENYYPTTDVSQLDTIFKKIGASVTRLYLSN